MVVVLRFEVDFIREIKVIFSSILRFLCRGEAFFLSSEGLVV
jgi:hypothetical protein